MPLVIVNRGCCRESTLDEVAQDALRGGLQRLLERPVKGVQAQALFQRQRGLPVPPQPCTGFLSDELSTNIFSSAGPPAAPAPPTGAPPAL